MEISITFGADPGNAPSLRRWLMAERRLRGHAVVSASPAVQGPGQMGGALDVVNVVLSNSIALGSLITSLAAWRNSRPRPPQIRLERGGSVVTMYDSSPELVERILREWSGTSDSEPTPDVPAPDVPATDGDGE